MCNVADLKAFVGLDYHDSVVQVCVLDRKVRCWVMRVANQLGAHPGVRGQCAERPTRRRGLPSKLVAVPRIWPSSCGNGVGRLNLRMPASARG